MYTYGYLFYIPINVIYVSIFAIKGILKKKKKGILFFYLNFWHLPEFLYRKSIFSYFYRWR